MDKAKSKENGMPTNKEAISKIVSVLSTKVFEKKGKEIIEFIEENPVEGEHPYEQAFRLGLTILFCSAMQGMELTENK